EAEWLSALVAVLLGSALLEGQLPWHAPHWLLLCQLVLGALGFALARLLPGWKRLFVPEARATEMAPQQARQGFFGLGLHEQREWTAAAGGRVGRERGGPDRERERGAGQRGDRQRQAPDRHVEWKDERPRKVRLAEPQPEHCRLRGGERAEHAAAVRAGEVAT